MFTSLEVGEVAKRRYSSPDEAKAAMRAIRTLLWKKGLGGQVRMWRVAGDPSMVCIERIQKEKPTLA